MDRIKKLVKEKLCKKGEAYRKRRMAAGEKSSAYLSGRAVKVCKGQMSGTKKKKKKKTNENKERYTGGAAAFDYKLKDLAWDNIVYFFGDGQIGFPNPSDEISVINSELGFDRWKEKTLERYPNIIISVLPQSKGTYDKIEITDKEFNKDKESYIQGKAKALQSYSNIDEADTSLMLYNDSEGNSAKIDPHPEFGYMATIYGENDYQLSHKNLEGLVAKLKKEGFVRQMSESINLSDYNEDMEKIIKRGIKRINVGSSDEEDLLYYVHNNWMGGNITAEEAMKKISDYLSPMKENIDPEAQRKHKGKAAPYGSAYKEIDESKIIESLRDWFKKEDWVRINTSGNIAGKCGTIKKGKPTTRCLPRKKAQSLTKAQRKATVAKKVRGSKKGKQFVKNTKKSEFKKK